MNASNPEGKSAKTVVRIFVVGHTNAGKTSWLWNLPLKTAAGWLGERDEKISGVPNTTKDFQGYSYTLGGMSVELQDSPGLNHSPKILFELRRQFGDRPSPEDLRKCLRGDALQGWPEDRHVLRTLLNADILIHVIDCSLDMNDYSLPEFELLRRLGKKTIVILNFLCNQANERHRTEEWQTCLRAEGAHWIIPFDAFVRSGDADAAFSQALLDCMAGDERRPLIEKFVNYIRHARERRLEIACHRVAEVAVNLYNLEISRRDVSKEEAEAVKKQLSDEFWKCFHENYEVLLRDLPSDFDLTGCEIPHGAPGGEAALYGQSDVFDSERCLNDDALKGPAGTMLERIKNSVSPFQRFRELQKKVKDSTKFATPQRQAVIYTTTIVGAGLGLAVDAAFGGVTGGMPTAASAAGGLALGLAIVGAPAAMSSYDGKQRLVVARASSEVVNEFLHDTLCYMCQLYSRGRANDRPLLRPVELAVNSASYYAVQQLLEKECKNRPRWSRWNSGVEFNEENATRVSVVSKIAGLLATEVKKFPVTPK